MKHLAVVASFIVSSFLLLQGCAPDGTPPTLGALELDSTEVASGSFITGHIRIEDNDANLGGGLVVVTTRGGNGSHSDTARIEDVENLRATTANLKIHVASTSPKGERNVEVIVYDGDGNASDPKTAMFTVK